MQNSALEYVCIIIILLIEVLPQLYKSQCGLNLIGDESHDNTCFASAIHLQILQFF